MKFQQFLERKDNFVRVGVVGYFSQKFDKEVAAKYLAKAFDKIEADHKARSGFKCISGLTDFGIPALAYREAVKRNWDTVGVACEKVNHLKDYKLFPVDEKVIEGEEWGDESNRFISMLDILVKIGGGEQSEAEAALARKSNIPVMEYDLKAE